MKYTQPHNTNNRNNIVHQPEFLRSLLHRSEERRVGKECRSRGSPYHSKKKEENVLPTQAHLRLHRPLLVNQLSWPPTRPSYHRETLAQAHVPPSVLPNRPRLPARILPPPT